MRYKYDIAFLFSLAAIFYAFYFDAVISKEFTAQRHYADRVTEGEVISFPFRNLSQQDVLAYTIKGNFHSTSAQIIDARFKFDDEILAINLNGHSLDLDEAKRKYGAQRLLYTPDGYVIPLALEIGDNIIEVASRDFGGELIFQIERVLGLTDYLKLSLVVLSLGLLTYGSLTDTTQPARLRFYLFASISCCFVLLLQLIKDHPFILDEFYHYIQLATIKNRGELYEGVTPLPGYHLFLLAWGAIFDQFSLSFFRHINVGIALLSLGAFLFAVHGIDKKYSKEKTLQYLFFPLLLPHFFLVYTDVLSMGLVLLCMGFLLRERYDLAGLCAIASVLVRQNNIIWLVFVGLFVLWSKYRFDLRGMHLATALKDNVVVLLGGIAFTAFVIINGGVAMAVEHAHPSYTLHLSNVYFSLFCVFLLFLPLNIANATKVFGLLKNKRWLLPFCALCLAYFFFTFEVDYPFNDNRLLARNNLLHYFTASAWRTLCFGLCVIYAALSIAVTKLHRQELLLLHPLALLYLMPSWVVEPRYAIAPLLLFNLFRRPTSPRVEFALTMLFIATCLYIFLGYQTNKFIL